MKKKRINAAGRTVLLSTTLFCLLFFTSCKQEKNNSKTQISQNPQKDYFPEKLNVNYATGFKVAYFGNYKVLKIINPYKNSTDTLTYVLTQKGTPQPSGYEDAQFVEIPIQTFACVYTPHVAFADILESTDIIKGFASPEYIINPFVKKGLKKGTITYIGQPDDLNQETLLSLNPQVLMISGVTISDLTRYKMLIESGISILVNSEWREKNPLGRAEWLKMLALFLNKETLANEKFQHIEQEYLKLKELTTGIKNRPNIITGLSYKDAWFIPGGRSFMSHLIKDAGATYPWVNDSTTASFPLSFEAVYAKGLKADFWLNPEYASSKKDLINVDARLADFKAYQSGRVYNHYNKTKENGANEYWESGVLNPHVVLADLIKIFHPELLPEHKLYYYKQLK